MPRFNYTNRSRIYQRDVDIELVEFGKGHVKPEVHLEIAQYDFPDDAPIWLEFYTSTFLSRIQFGTIGKQGFKGPSVIQNGPDPSELKVRVKVLEPDSSSSRILGVMKGCKPGYRDEDSEKRNESLLELKSTPLNGEIWRVEVPQEIDEAPILHIDDKMPDHKGLAGQDWFKSLVLPQVFQEILTTIIVIQGFPDYEDDSNWGAWLRLAQHFAPGDKEIPEVNSNSPEFSEQSSDAIDWIQGVVSSWARSAGYRDSFSKFVKGAGQ